MVYCREKDSGLCQYTRVYVGFGITIKTRRFGRGELWRDVDSLC